MFISSFSAGFISLVSIIKMFVLCLFDKYVLKSVNLLLNFAGNLSLG